MKDMAPGGIRWICWWLLGCMVFLPARVLEADTTTVDVLVITNSLAQTSAGGTNYFTGSVGIGTAEPGSRLHVAGAARFDEGITYIPPRGGIGMGPYTNGSPIGYDTNAPWLTVESDTNALAQLAGHTNVSGNVHHFTGADIAVAGGLTNYVETDPRWAAVSNAVSLGAAQGEMAFLWGNHGTNGYAQNAAVNGLSERLDHVEARQNLADAELIVMAMNNLANNLVFGLSFIQGRTWSFCDPGDVEWSANMFTNAAGYVRSGNSLSQAMYFDEYNYADGPISAMPAIDNDPAWSFAFWVRNYNPHDGCSCFINAFFGSWYAGGGQCPGYDASVGFNYSDVSANVSYQSDTMWDNDWHHISAAYDGSTARVYLDGANVYTTNGVSTHIDPSGALMVNAHTYGEWGAPYAAYDELALWNRALSGAEIGTLYGGGTGYRINASSGPGTNGLVYLYHFDGDLASAATANTLTIQGSGSYIGGIVPGAFPGNMAITSVPWTWGNPDDVSEVIASVVLTNSTPATNLMLEATANGGTNWTVVPITNLYSTGHHDGVAVYAWGPDFAGVGVAPGKTLQLRLTTANDVENFRVYGASIIGR